MKTLALTALILLSIVARSQSVSSYVINSAGSSYSQGYYSIDWSIGEVPLVSTMQSNPEMILTNGFLQPNLSYNDGDARRRFGNDEIRIMPNPTHGKIEVNISTTEKGTLFLFVYDINGKILRTENLLSAGFMTSKIIDLTAFASSSYLLRIELIPSPGSVSKTGSYKIIKL